MVLPSPAPTDLVVALAEARDAARDARWLTRAERRECAALATAAQRDDYRAARLAAKRATGRPPRDVAVLRRPHGPPALLVRGARGSWHRAPLALSLAHRDGLAAAVAAPRGRRVGVDVERAGSVAPEHVRYFAAPSERRAGPADASELWALKEAAWKALRLDASCPLRALELEFDGRGAVRAVSVRGRRLPAWSVVARPWPAHLVAVVGVGGL